MIRTTAGATKRTDSYGGRFLMDDGPLIGESLPKVSESSSVSRRAYLARANCLDQGWKRASA